MQQSEIMEVAGGPVAFQTGRFTREGKIWIVIVSIMLLVGMVKGINLILLFGYFLAVLLWVNYRLASKTVQQLTGERVADTILQAGAPGRWTVHLHHSGNRLARGWTLIDSGPDHRIGWHGILTTPDSEHELRQSIVLPNRGTYRCEPLTVVSRYPFGLVQHSAQVGIASEFLVWPRIGHIHGERFRHWVLKTAVGDGQNHQRFRHLTTQEADIHGLRPFRTGDSPRWVHWRTSARRGELMVREFEDSSPPQLLIIVEPFLPAEPTVVQVDQFERAISLAASVAQEWCRDPGSRLVFLLAGTTIKAHRGSCHRGLLQGILDDLAAESGLAGDPGNLMPHLIGVQKMPAMVITSREQTSLPMQLTGALGRTPASVHPNEEPSWYFPPGTATDREFRT
jgi:uncharacterized protein (DUF58 family)